MGGKWGFRNNDAVVTISMLVTVTADEDNGVFFVTGSNTYRLNAGQTGDDQFLYFGSDDVVLTQNTIFYFNKDTFVSLGPNCIIDIDRTGPWFNGSDHIQLIGEDSRQIELRSLGSKTGQFADADGTIVFGRNQVLDMSGTTGAIDSIFASAGRAADVRIYEAALHGISRITRDIPRDILLLCNEPTYSVFFRFGRTTHSVNQRILDTFINEIASRQHEDRAVCISSPIAGEMM